MEFSSGILMGILALVIDGFIFSHPEYKHLAPKLPQRVPLHVNGNADGITVKQVLSHQHSIERLFAHCARVESFFALIDFKQFHDLMGKDEQFMFVILKEIDMISKNGGGREMQKKKLNVNYPI